MATAPNTDDVIRRMLKTTRTIAVVGLSASVFRPSHGVARYLQSAGYRIIPVNPNISEVLGEQAYPDLRSIPEPVDLVDVFRRPEFVPEITEAAIAIGARSLWLQDGVVAPQSAARAEAAGLLVVMDDCLMRRHRQFARELTA